MRWILLILITTPSYAFETILCRGAIETYDCQTYSEDEEYLEDVIHVYESEGFSESERQDVDEYPKNQDYYAPLIFPLPRYW